MDWLMIPALFVIAAVFIVATFWESQGEADDKEAFFLMRGLYAEECVWRINNDIKPVFV